MQWLGAHGRWRAGCGVVKRLACDPKPPLRHVILYLHWEVEVVTDDCGARRSKDELGQLVIEQEESDKIW